MADLSFHVVSNEQLDSVEWDKFVKNSPQGSIYALFGYAMAIAPDWQAIIIKKGETWQAVMPTIFRKKWGLSYLTHPVFAQYWGILFSGESPNNVYDQISRKRKVLLAVLEALADQRLVTQYFSPAFDYPLPFIWQGYTLKPRYTYHLNLEKEKEILWKGLANSLRRQVSKARKNDLVFLQNEDLGDLQSMIQLNKESGHDLTGTGKDLTQPLERIWEYLQKNDLGFSCSVYNSGNKIMASGLFALYPKQKKAIYMIGGYDPQEGASGAMSFLMYEAILAAKDRGYALFDFEGSMIEGVEAFFRKFGAHPVTYLQIDKNKLPLPLRWIHALR